MTREALCKRSLMKNRKRRKSDTVGRLKFNKRLNVRIITFLRLAFKCFWSSSSLRSVIVVHIWANVLLCGAERRKRSGQGRFFSCWTEFLADDLKHFRQVQVFEVQPHWEKHSVQVFKLQAYLRSVLKSCAHLCKCFAEWCPATETNIMTTARTDFIDEPSEVLVNS